MKNNKYLILSILFVGLAFLLGSCSDYLDLSPTDKTTAKLQWSKPEYGRLATNNFYHYINIYGPYNDDGNDGQSQIGLTEGATETLKYGSLTRMPHMGFANELAYGLTTSDPYSTASSLGRWEKLYARVIKVNETFADFRRFASFDQTTMEHFEAEIKFFRAFIYFELIKRHKTVILYDEKLEVVKNKALNTEIEGWDMVQADLEYAIKYLPETWSGVNEGRVTKGAAAAFMSKAMLYAQRWDVAKTAAKIVIDLEKYDLNNDFKKAFTSAYGESANKESILEFRYLSTGPSHNFDDRFSPKGDAGVVIGGMGTPTQEMVESFEKADGTGFADWTPWHSTDGTSLTPPYASLEPRFHATVLYNEAMWKGRKLEPFVDGRDGWCSYKDEPDPKGRTTTGYYLRKLVDEGHDMSTKPRSTQTWVSIRYAEVLLNYAEACHKSGDKDQANWAVGKIRGRVSLPYANKSGDQLMDAIRQERKVELAYEGHLYWDMRRWKLSHIAYSGSKSRVNGLKIEKIAENTFKYTYVDCDKQDRYFPEKLYIIPLPENEIKNNTAVQQFSEWR